MPATSGDPEIGPVMPGPPPGGSRWRRVFAGEERQLAVLRRWLASFLPECAARDDVACVATELGANAIRHTASGQDGWFAVEVTWYRSAVRVAVADAGAPSGPRVISDPDGENGRGLLLVSGLSTRTGVAGDRRGRLVWADVGWEAASAGVVPARARGAAAGDDYSRLARWLSGLSASAGWPSARWSASRWLAAASGTGGTVPEPTARELARLLGEIRDARSRRGAVIRGWRPRVVSQRDGAGAQETGAIPPARPGAARW